MGRLGPKRWYSPVVIESELTLRDRRVPFSRLNGNNASDDTNLGNHSYGLQCFNNDEKVLAGVDFIPM